MVENGDIYEVSNVEQSGSNVEITTFAGADRGYKASYEAFIKLENWVTFKEVVNKLGSGAGMVLFGFTCEEWESFQKKVNEFKAE